MKIEGIRRAEVHFVTTDGQVHCEYTRYGSDCWFVRIGESDEPVYDYQELEELFQSALDRGSCDAADRGED